MRTAAYASLPTEQRHPLTQRLNDLTTLQLLRLMNQEDAQLVRVVAGKLSSIARAIRLIARTLKVGGRLFFVGAGTSGRLGVLEAAECPPTFHTSPSLIQAIMAGGPGAVFRSREGAEDNRLEARRVIRQKVKPTDGVVGITASGVTPFVDAALVEASRLGARTILLTCNIRSPIPAMVRIRIPVGPEILTGSTRLKSATATKRVLNMLTVGTMVRLGRTSGNLMVDLRPISRKLRARACRIIRLLTGCSERRAAQLLKASAGSVRAAVELHKMSLWDR